MKELFPHHTIGDFINQPLNQTEFEILQFEKMEEPEMGNVYPSCCYEYEK